MADVPQAVQITQLVLNAVVPVASGLVGVVLGGVLTLKRERWTLKRELYTGLREGLDGMLFEFERFAHIVDQARRHSDPSRKHILVNDALARRDPFYEAVRGYRRARTQADIVLSARVLKLLDAVDAEAMAATNTSDLSGGSSR